MTELAKKPEQQLGVKQYFNQPAVMSKFKELLGARSSSFVTSVLQAVSSNPELLKADPASIYNCAATAAILDLPINQNLGLAYIIPFGVKQKDGSYKKLAQFQLGYKGIIQLAMRSGQFVRLNATDVREGEIKRQNRMTGEIDFDWNQDLKERSSKKVVGYLSYFRLTNGFESEFYMSIEEIEAHAKRYSQSYKAGYGQWKDNFDKMSLKTVTKLHLNSGQAPLSMQMQTAITVDQAVIKDDSATDVEYSDHEIIQVDVELERFSAHLESCKSLDELDMLCTSFDEELPTELAQKVAEKRKELGK